MGVAVISALLAERVNRLNIEIHYFDGHVSEVVSQLAYRIDTMSLFMKLMPMKDHRAPWLGSSLSLHVIYSNVLWEVDLYKHTWQPVCSICLIGD